MLRTKSILKPLEDADGVRLSVMSRHTLNDGKTPHPQITLKSYDEWSLIFAPPLKLVGDYYRRNLPWDEFEKRYLDYLRTPQVQMKVRALAERSLDSTLTLLCVEDSPDYCHRRLLAEECKRLQPEITLNIQ